MTERLWFMVGLTLLSVLVRSSGADEVEIPLTGTRTERIFTVRAPAKEQLASLSFAATQR